MDSIRSICLPCFLNLLHSSLLPIGNYGADPSGSASTVTTPSISKNCISVGATPSFQSQYQSPTTIAPVYLATLTVAAGAQPLFKRTFRVLQASFGPQFLPTLNGRSLPVVAASPQVSTRSFIHLSSLAFHKLHYRWSIRGIRS